MIAYYAVIYLFTYIVFLFFKLIYLFLLSQLYLNIV